MITMRMMSARLLVSMTCAGGLLLLLSGIGGLRAAEKGYGELRKEYEEYVAPPYYESVIAPREIPQLPEDEGEKFLREKVEELLEIKTRWEELTKKFPREGRFFSPSERAVEEVQEIVNADAIQERLARDVDLDITLATAVFRNRKLKQAKRELEATLERYSQVTNLDEIMRQYASFVEALMTRVGPQRQMEMIQTRFPFPGILSLKGDIVNKEVEIAREQYEIGLRDLVTSVRQVYYELAYTDEAINITEQSLDILERLEQIATTLYATGRTSYTDVIKIQIRTETVDNDLKKLRDKRATLAVELNSLLDLPAGFQPGPLKNPELQELVLDRDQLIEMGLESRQEIRALKLMIEKMALMIEMAEREIYPDYTLGYSYFQNVEQLQVGTQATEETFNTRPEMPPMSWFGQMDAYIREVRSKLAATQEELTDATNMLKAEVKETLFGYANARRLRRLYKDEILGRVKESLDLAIVRYQTGALTFPDVADAESNWLEFNLDYQRSITDQNQQFAGLERIVGRTFGGLAE